MSLFDFSNIQHRRGMGKLDLVRKLTELYREVIDYAFFFYIIKEDGDYKPVKSADEFVKRIPEWISLLDLLQTRFEEMDALPVSRELYVDLISLVRDWFSVQFPERTESMESIKQKLEPVRDRNIFTQTHSLFAVIQDWATFKERQKKKAE